MRRYRRTFTGIAIIVSALAALLWSTQAQAHDGQKRGKQVKILDDCDPTTFNAAFGDGVCVGDGRTTLDDFLAELAATKAAADWKFKPSMLKIKDGRPVLLENRGGETHTWTLVDQFGGGFIDFLNQLTGNPDPAPECAQTDADGNLVPQPPSPVNVFVEAGKDVAFDAAGLAPGTYKFQCCIHPWMRVVLTVH